MRDLVSGGLALGYLVAALFFLRFYRETSDRLFGIFGAAFVLLAAQRVALSVLTNAGYDTTWLYGVRLLAFLLILAAIIDKNRASAP